jgi:hypothetical protein
MCALHARRGLTPGGWLGNRVVGWWRTWLPKTIEAFLDVPMALCECHVSLGDHQNAMQTGKRTRNERAVMGFRVRGWTSPVAAKDGRRDVG